VRFLERGLAFLLHRNFHDSGVLHLDEAVGDHVVECGKKLVYLLRRVDKFDPDRKMLR